MRGGRREVRFAVRTEPFLVGRAGLEPATVGTAQGERPVPPASPPPFGPCWTRTSDLGIKSPAEQAVAKCKKRKGAAKRTVRRCSELQRAVGDGDESVLSLVLPGVAAGDNWTTRPEAANLGGTRVNQLDVLLRNWLPQPLE